MKRKNEFSCAKNNFFASFLNITTNKFFVVVGDHSFKISYSAFKERLKEVHPSFGLIEGYVTGDYKEMVYITNIKNEVDARGSKRRFLIVGKNTVNIIVKEFETETYGYAEEVLLQEASVLSKNQFKKLQLLEVDDIKTIQL